MKFYVHAAVVVAVALDAVAVGGAVLLLSRLLQLLM